MHASIISAFFLSLMASAAPTGCTQYTVKDGDYCSGIANANGITLQQFYDYNGGNGKFGGADCPSLWVGTVVCVSAP
ncbi:hypothetical protein BT63DRAFT_429797 [Microthyrium microscopicum]|uniref:LysM domain-containing protein n=1 Tax=Microthyrium microscopicum TaxID=703497 RepID=A0A6A6TWV3_9PEZI|nr:hypothetical protein BT63DRAFT_429797 [Microthyrium microscopicum]